MGAALDLAGRRAIVTGGASGIGHQTAVHLARLGADVVVADIDEAGGAVVADQVDGSFAPLDVGDAAAWQRVTETSGPFDIAFLNAGVATEAGQPPVDGVPLANLTDEAYRRITSVNLDGVVFGIRAVLPGMVARGRGDIVATASMAGLEPIAMDPVYGMTKHGVVGLVRSVAEAIRTAASAPDVCVSALCPGFADTRIVSDEARAVIAQLGLEIMRPEIVAEVVVRALDERRQGAEWIVWPGTEPRVYHRAPALPSEGDAP